MIDVADEADGLSTLSSLEIEELEKNVQFNQTRQGTRLAFHEYGDPRGRPIIFYHGTGSHVHVMLLHKPGLKYGFRIIAPDRPGVAQSDFRPGWTILEYARDMADLADRLGIGSFGAIGISGGGPAYDAQTVYKQWGFNLSDIEIHIEVFHGASDKFVPPKFGEYLAKNAKNVRLNLLEGQGHFYHLAYGYQLLKKVAELFYAGNGLEK